MRLQNQGPSHIPIAERSLLLRCLWKIGIPLELKPGNQLSSRVNLGYRENFRVAVVTSCSLYPCDSVLETLWSSIKVVKAPVLFDVEHGIALRTMQGNRASPQGEFKVSWVFSSCSRNLGYILELIVGMAIRNSSLFSDVRTPV